MVTALNGEEALKKAAEHKFDLALIDIKMPRLNGIAVFRELKKISPQTIVVIMTGTPMEELVNENIEFPGIVELEKEALKMGAFGVVHKPFDVGKLVFLVESLLKDKNQ